MSKQDRQGVRTAAELERKYDLGALSAQKNDASKLSTLISQLTQDVTRLNLALKNVHPVGAIYTSISEIEPSELFGGSWELLTEGQLVVGSATEEGEEIFFSNAKIYVWKRIA